MLIASRGLSQTYLKRTFPNSHHIDLPDREVTYAVNGAKPSILARAILQPGINRTQQNWTEEIIRKHGVTRIISDNVYGVYSTKVKSILITHQLQLKTKFFRSPANKTLANWINRFDEVWVPDISGEGSISGNLTKNQYITTDVHHIGILTALKPVQVDKIDFDILALISGPEPLRSQLENTLEKHLDQLNGNHAIVRGTKKPKSAPKNSEINYFDLLNNDELSHLMSRSRAVICRSGYSSLMDLIAFGKPAILIPTPVQPEQAYLGKRCGEKGWFTVSSQNSPLSTKPIFGHSGVIPNKFEERVLASLY